MKTGIKFGALMGASYFTIFTLDYYLKLDTGPLTAILTFGIFIALLVFGLKEFKKKAYNGKINYAQSLYSGLYIVVFAALFTAFANWIFLTAIDKNYKEKAMAQMKVNLPKAKMTDAERKKAWEEFENAQDLSRITGGILLSTAIFTMIVNTIASAFIRNEDTFNKVPN
jgi:prepilin signal peptidase PulO-like enzyme (type II secretory pathway)